LSQVTYKIIEGHVVAYYAVAVYYASIACVPLFNAARLLS